MESITIEAVDSIVFTFGITFVEDTIQYILQHLQDPVEKLKREMTVPSKSIVRKVYVPLTWIKPPRFNSAWLKRSSGCEQTELSTSLCLRTESETEEKQPTQLWERKIEDLEKEMLDLRVEVAKLLLLQESRNLREESPNSNNQRLSPNKEVSSSTSVMMPPRPPPPPPPLPPTPKPPSRVPLIRVKVKAIPSTPVRDSTSSIMEELARRPPRLRHVERSPGGRPVRTQVEVNDPADKLAEILRKRFDAMHSPARDPYLISPRNSPNTPELFGH